MTWRRLIINLLSSTTQTKTKAKQSKSSKRYQMHIVCWVIQPKRNSTTNKESIWLRIRFAELKPINNRDLEVLQVVTSTEVKAGVNKEATNNSRATLTTVIPEATSITKQTDTETKKQKERLVSFLKNSNANRDSTTRKLCVKNNVELKNKEDNLTNNLIRLHLLLWRSSNFLCADYFVCSFGALQWCLFSECCLAEQIKESVTCKST